MKTLREIKEIERAKHRINNHHNRAKHKTQTKTLIQEFKQLHLKCFYSKCKRNATGFFNRKPFCQKHYNLLKYQMKNKGVKQ